MRKLVRLRITGRVQGVGYRAFVEMQAEMLDLDGWVRNRRDGSVEAVAAGSADKIERLIAECREGPPASLVTDVNVIEATEEMLGLRRGGEKFSFLPTAYRNTASNCSRSTRSTFSMFACTPRSASDVTP